MAPAINRRRLLLALLVYQARKRRNATERHRSMYIRDIFIRREKLGEIQLVKYLHEDEFYHHRYFRMTKESFFKIHDRIKDAITHPPNHVRPISSFMRLAITLRYLASGNAQFSMGMSYRVHPSSVCKMLPEVMSAICKEFGDEYLRVPTTEDYVNIATEFETKWGFPMCCGAIDGKHVRMKAPEHSGSRCINYKGSFSLVLMAVVDGSYMFRLVDIGSSGSNSDGGVLLKSALGNALENGRLPFPRAQQTTSGELLSSVLVGDDGFPLRRNLLKPFNPPRNHDEKIFNYRLSRARMVVENAFGILAARWRIYHTAIQAKEDLVKQIVRTTILLYNFLRMQNDDSNITTDTFENGHIREGNWRETVENDSNLSAVGRFGSNNASATAHQVREKFQRHFVSETGRLSWQDDYVRRIC